MIATLRIKNIALIKDLSIELSEGLNILSGETGAGKSIIIDSLRFVLGDRADRGLIRHGEEVASVEVVFTNYTPTVDAILAEQDIEAEDNLIIFRKMNTAGKGEARINGRASSIATVRRIVSLLVDVHSQNEHQSLLDSANHIVILDNFAGNTADVASFKSHYQAIKDIKAKLDDFSDPDERARRIDVFRYQMSEIEEANVTEGEEEALVAERYKLLNFQKIATRIADALRALDAVSDGAGEALGALKSVTKYDESLIDTADRIESLKIEAQDITDTLKDAQTEAGGERELDKIEERLGTVRKIKKKYGATVADINTFYEKAKADCEKLESAEAEIAELNKRLATEEKQAHALAARLHDARVKAGVGFEKRIIANLTDLGMANTTFKADIVHTPEKLNSEGADTVEFLISPNLGEPLKPLAKVASGGETSRFMLALKNIIAELDGIGTIVFDEIDTGISGKIAKTVAQKLYNIASIRQVLAITHLPQLAAMADTQYLISKGVVDAKTQTSVTPLTPDDAIAEIMRLSGSAENSTAGLASAKEMKSLANEYKNNIKKGL